MTDFNKTTRWLNEFMHTYDLSMAEALRWMVSLAEGITEIEVDPDQQLATVVKGRFGRTRVQKLVIRYPDRKVIKEPPPDTPPDLHLIHGGKT